MSGRFLVKPVVGVLALLLLCAAAMPARASEDVVLLLDNSAGMRNVAARFQTARAAHDFVDHQAPGTRVALVAFAATPTVLLPLTADDARGRAQLRAALRRLDYRDANPDVTAGVRQALYELVMNGKNDAGKSIVVISAGEGGAQRAADRDQTRWLTQSLVPAAIFNRVRVFSIVPGAKADAFALRPVAMNTGGAYYAPTNAAELAEALQQVRTTLELPLAAAAPPLPPNLKLSAMATGQNGVPQAGNFATPLTQRSPPPSRMRWLWLVLVIAVLVAAAGIYAAWNTRSLRRPRKPQTPPAPAGEGPRAVLYDISNPNDIRRFELGERATLLGRVAGYDPEVQYILVKEKTVGRCHAVIERRGHSFWLMDQGSINGTFVNNERINADRALKHGDIVAIHRHEFEFMIPDYFESESTVVGARETATT